MKHLLSALTTVWLLSSCQRNIEKPLVCALSDNSPYSYYAIRCPSAFTPNGDGKNDRYRIIMTGVPATAFALRIFDKDGKALFETADTGTIGWDGRNSAGVNMPPGRYRAEVSFSNLQGETYTHSFCVGLLSYGGGSCIPRSGDGEYFFADMYESGGFNGRTAESVCP